MNDFDFYTGTWDIINRRRTDFLEDSCFVQEATEWEEFPAVSTASRHLGGMANFDEVEFPMKGLRGVTLRLFDPEREEWSLYWISSRTGTLTTPVVGRFVDGRGDFRGDDRIDGRDIRVRYLWSDITATTAHWEQAFSMDGERTWITNWIMESTRR
jgi:hypothetical protein